MLEICTFLFFSCAQCGQSLFLKTGRERALKKDRAALTSLAPWFRAMSQIFSHDSSGGIPGPVMCLRDRCVSQSFGQKALLAMRIAFCRCLCESLELKDFPSE